MKKMPLFTISSVLFFSCLVSCASHQALMTRYSFEEIQIGTPVSSIQATLGKPYAVHSRGNGIAEYEYIERIEQGEEIVADNHYFLLVSDDKVIGKRTHAENPSDFDFLYRDPSSLSP